MEISYEKGMKSSDTVPEIKRVIRSLKNYEHTSSLTVLAENCVVLRATSPRDSAVQTLSITYRSDIYAGDIYTVDFLPFEFRTATCNKELLPEFLARLGEYSFIKLSFIEWSHDSQDFILALTYDFPSEKYERLSDLNDYAIFRLQEVYVMESEAINIVFSSEA